MSSAGKSRLSLIGGAVAVLLLVAVTVFAVSRPGDEDAAPVPPTTTTAAESPVDKGLAELQAAVAQSEQALAQARGAQGQVSAALADAQKALADSAESLQGLSSSGEGRAIAEGTVDELQGAVDAAKGGSSALDGAQSAATAARDNVERLTGQLRSSQSPETQDLLRRAQDQVGTTQQQLDTIRATTRDSQDTIQKLLDKAQGQLGE